MAIRYFDKSYIAGGNFFSKLDIANPRPGLTLDHRAFVLISMLSTSFIAHYNAPKFYAELKNPTISRFNDVTKGVIYCQHH
jgi:hypothetical protein